MRYQAEVPTADGDDVMQEIQCDECNHIFTEEVYVENNEWETRCPKCNRRITGELDE